MQTLLIVTRDFFWGGRGVGLRMSGLHWTCCPKRPFLNLKHTFKHFSSSILLFFSSKETHMVERFTWQASMDRKSIMTAHIPFKQHITPFSHIPGRHHHHHHHIYTLTQLFKIQFFFSPLQKKVRTDDRHSRVTERHKWNWLVGTWLQELVDNSMCVFFTISQPT